MTYKYSEDFLNKTIALWQPRCPHPLTLQDAEEIISNSVELIKLLGDLDRKYKSVGSMKGKEPVNVTS